MFDLAEFLQRELDTHRKEKPTLILPESFDSRTLQVALRLIRYANLVILADEVSIQRYAAEHCPQIPSTRLAFLLKNARFVDIKRETELTAKLKRELLSVAKNGENELSDKDVSEFVSSPVGFAILCTRLGYADAVVGGLQNGPSEFIRPALKYLRGKTDPFEVGFFMLPDGSHDSLFPGNIAIFADIGVTIRMTPEKLANIAVGACRMTRDLFPEAIMPQIRGVIISHSTKGSDEGPSVELQREAALLIPDKLKKLAQENEGYKSIKVDSEVQVCYAHGAGPTFQYNSGAQLTGAKAVTNVLIAPNLDLGNFLYHSYASNYPDSIKFSQMGGVGLKIVEFARESRWEDVLVGVKAHILRLWKYGNWSSTPNDYFFKRYRVLAVNPGSTSTKISVFEGERELFTEELDHPQEKLSQFSKLTEQFSMRKEAVLKALADKNISTASLDAIVARGGLLYPMSSGVYKVSDKILEDLRNNVQGEHASNLGGLIAKELSDDTGKSSYIVDPPVVDEVDPIARITGIKEIKRKVISHALSQIATAKRYAEESGVFYNELNLIVAHLGGGISVGAHHKGRYIDVNDALTGEGPFSPERSGSLPPGQIIAMCFSGKYSEKELKLLNKGKGGLISLLGTSDFREIERKYREGFQEVIDVVKALAYQIAKEITSLIPAFNGEKADHILLTGGLTKSEILTDLIKSRLAGTGIGIKTYPGQNEMRALAYNAVRVLQGKEEIKIYYGRQN
ncbi:MAG: butyrate kinase [Fibrobacteres bacterium]|nr:butyrate kinase [Fibrobacterota bacterium]